MKSTYTYCLLSLFALILGLICIMTSSFATSIPHSLSELLFVFSIFFLLGGLLGYLGCYKKYKKIKILFHGDVHILAHWKFDPKSSPLVTSLLEEHKFSQIYTTSLIIILCLVFACGFYFTEYTYSTHFGTSLIILSLLIGIGIYLFIPIYHASKVCSLIDVIISEENIYFLGHLYSLQQSIYFLEDIKLEITDSPHFELLYSAYDINGSPRYSVIIPVSPDDIANALAIQTHFQEQIAKIVSSKL